MTNTTEQIRSLSAMALGMVKNEADIVESFVRHNLHFVDLMVLLDNGSTDGTREILAALQQEGLPLLVIDDPVFGYFQSEKMTELYRRMVPVFQPEVVYLLDADEFLRAPDRAAMDKLLRQVPAGAQALIPWMTHIPDPRCSTADLLREPLACSPWRRSAEEPQYHKAIIKRCPSMDLDLIIDQGNHAVRSARGNALQAVLVSGVHLVHLPVRSVEQITAKAVNGWLAYLVRNRQTQGVLQGSQWQVLYDRVTRGKLLGKDDVVALALDYAQRELAGRSLQTHAVHDPCPGFHGPLRYLDLGRHDPLAKVALGVAEHLQSDEGAHPRANERTDAPVDVAAVRCIMQGRRLRSYFSQASDWVRAMETLWPDCVLANRATAEALLLPELVAADVPALAGQFQTSASRRVLAWLPVGHSPRDMDDVLAAFARLGWEPDPLATLSARAVSAFGILRHGALVMRPRADGNEDRARAMAAALRAMSTAPHPWTDPPSQWVAHALQPLRLGLDPGARASASAADKGKRVGDPIHAPDTSALTARPSEVLIPPSVLFGRARPRLQRARPTV